MRALVQRVSKASVVIDGREHAAIGRGLLVLIGIESSDLEEDANWLAAKLTKLRVFPDSEEVMNESIQDIEGEFLVISQFTLHASTKKGNRPSYIKASRPDHAVPLYEYFLDKLWLESNCRVKSGVFGADMKVNLINDGPVTIWMDTKNKE